MRRLLFIGLLASTSFFACASPPDEASGGDDAITSETANILDFRFDAEVIASTRTDARNAIVSQLMYTQGILTTAGNGNGHVGNVKLSNVRETVEGGKKRVAYTASLPVAWPKYGATPTTYDLTLPLDSTSFDAFNAKYDGRCGRNEYGQDSFWHDWNPNAGGCAIDAADVSTSHVTVAPHAKETKNKYPEYDLIWEDDRLDVVAIFGIITSNTPNDWGYLEAQRFADGARGRLRDAQVTDNAPSPSVLKDTTITGKVTIAGRERDVKVDVLVVYELKSVGRDFDARYDALSEEADMVLYNGHAGLGENVNALARKGKVAPNKYQLLLLNGCQTFAYIDTTLTDRRREANGDADPDGTRFLDVVGNALPGYAHNLANMSNDLFDAVVQADAPRHYNDLLRGMPANHIVVVFGEEDNRFTP